MKALVQVNPLVITEVQWPNLIEGGLETIPLSILKFACGEIGQVNIETLKERYHRISRLDTEFFVAPNIESFREKITNPIRVAKANFILGNYISTIAVAAIVAEMIAMLLFEIYQLKLKEKSIGVEKQKNIFGSTFENLGQDRRVKILLGLGIIKNELKERFDRIRTIRRKYLHLWSQPTNSIEEDAYTLYDDVVRLVIQFTGIHMAEPGVVGFNPDFHLLMKEHGVLVEE